MARHVLNMARIRAESIQMVSRVHRPFRSVGHFQKVNVKVEYRRMLGKIALISQEDCTSHREMASSVSAPQGGLPVCTSHIRQGVLVIIASTLSAMTSRLLGKSMVTCRMASV